MKTFQIRVVRTVTDEVTIEQRAHTREEAEAEARRLAVDDVLAWQETAREYKTDTGEITSD